LTCLHTGPSSTYDAESYRRPTVASLNRSNSILSLRPTASSAGNSLISPPIASPHRSPSQMKDYFTQDEKNAIAGDYKLPQKDAQNRQAPSSALRQASRISTASQANQSPAKGRLAAQRNAILGKEDVHHARKIRAKRDHVRVKQTGSQYDTSTSISSASASAMNSATSSPNKSAMRDHSASCAIMAGPASSSANTSAIPFSSGRDRWR
jgi:hypothetical protein